MNVEYKSEIHNYTQLTLSKQEVSIINFVIESDKDFKVELYERNGTYFLFKGDKNRTVSDMIDYLEYILRHPNIKTLIRKQKIKKIKEGSN